MGKMNKYKKTILLSAGIFLILVLIATVCISAMAKKYVVHLNLPGNEYQDILVNVRGTGSCDVTKLKREGRELILLLENGKKGQMELIIECVHKENPELKDGILTGVTISRNGFFFFGPDMDFRGHQVVVALLSLYFLYISGLMFVGYRKYRQESVFLYSGLLRLGLFVYFLVQGFLFAGLCAVDILYSGSFGAYQVFSMASLILTVANLAMLPLIVLFAIGMSVSNIALIRHERVRFANLLGFMISALMLSGSMGIFVLMYFSSGYLAPEPKDIAVLFIRTASSSVFLYMVCMLFATEARLFFVARHEPPFDRDFIIILGCSIRKDGTLYPLLRGRVDRAIRFYHDQMEKTGKRAVFIPSGGQGSDEVISEGEAMKNYLVSQGIPEEQIIPETASKTTFENMKFSKQIIDEQKKGAKVVFSTTNYHVFRSGMIALSAGLHVEGIASRTKWYFWPNAQIREFVGLLAGKWKQHLIVCILLVMAAVPVAYGPILLNWFLSH